MLFNSWTFIALFLPVTLWVALRLKGPALLAWIAASSVVFYCFAGQAWFVLPMLVTIVLDYFLARAIARLDSASARLSLLLVSLTTNLGLLFYFKYAGFGARAATRLASALGVPGTGTLRTLSAHLGAVILPAGISFYTFQSLSYIVDVYRRECPPEKDFLKYAGFIAFFPHLVAGPLTRHNQLIPQLSKISQESIRPRWRTGLFLFSIGLCKKVIIADQIAWLVDTCLARAATMSMLGGWTAAIAYAMQIYFDFSAYSDMAIGLGRLFGVELPQNFDSPYKATSPRDFWRRWHITLSSWLRDYLYIPLGGSRCSGPRRMFNLMITMLLGGFWHGANWTFLIWGALHGLYLVVFHLFEGPWARLNEWARRLLTFGLVSYAWVWFRASSVEQALNWSKAMIGLGGGWMSTADLNIGYKKILLAALGITFFARNASRELDLTSLRPYQQIALGITVSYALLSLSDRATFLYFQF